MNIHSLESIKQSGFLGFKKIKDLKSDPSWIPSTKGVYLVLRPDNSPVEFVKIGTGGFFKGKDPNVSVDELKNNWIEETQIVYIGKAGGSSSDATLYSRLKQYLNFGQGINVGHWGGRYIWQIKNINDFLICWKTLPNDEPAEIESELLSQFHKQFNSLPFANLRN